MKKQRIVTIVFTFILFLLTSKMVYSQSSPMEDEGYLAFATTMPELEGGMPELVKKISYPPVAKKAGLEGKVYALAYVDEKGNVDKVKIIKGLGGGCDEEVERVLAKSKFKPGQHEGKTVKVKTTISVAFKLK
ncbi:MAG: energy transducer TonB [Ignavibacteriaceae bacterium]|nr:energy transducer TonB [Ignavibacteriaceae bacterium]